MNVEPANGGYSAQPVIDDVRSAHPAGSDSIPPAPAGFAGPPGLGSGSPEPLPTGPLPPGQPARRARARAWLMAHRRSVIGWLVLAGAFAAVTVRRGVQISEDTTLIWLAAALFVASLDDLRSWRRGLLRDWLPLYAVLALYSLLRGYASHVPWGPFLKPQLEIDRFIGGGQVLTYRLQHAFFHRHHLHVWDYAAWAVYTSHFFVSYVVAAVLWKRNHARFRRFISLFVGLTLVGYAGYVMYPAIPPWLASHGHRIGHAVRIVPVVWNHLGIHEAAALFENGNAFSNSIAAMPSLHAAYTMLLLLFFWPRARGWVRVLLVGYVLAMGISLVYLGEHFVTDELAGWACAAGVCFWGSRLLDRWGARRARRSGPVVPGGGAAVSPPGGEAGGQAEAEAGADAVVGA
jgi:membrane-associated phospholipid phosphatase